MAKRRERVRVTPDMSFSEMPGYLSTAEAAIVAHKSQGTIRKEIREGKIEACTVGAEYRIAKGDLFKGAMADA